jgi:hypothetical protein
LKATSPTRHQRRRQLPLILVPFSPTQFSVSFRFVVQARSEFVSQTPFSHCLSCLIFISWLFGGRGGKVQVRDI